MDNREQLNKKLLLVVLFLVAALSALASYRSVVSADDVSTPSIPAGENARTEDAPEFPQ